MQVTDGETMVGEVDELPQAVSSLLGGGADQPLAIIRRKTEPTATVYTGSVHEAGRLREIPLEGADVLALIPYHQIRERGFEALEGSEKLLYMVVTDSWKVDLETLARALPATPPEVEDIGFDLADEEYAEQVSSVIEDEIGGGEGANFVLRRTYRARTQAPAREAILAWLARLLAAESGAYWTFAFMGGGVAAVGASPERHVSAKAGTVLMNPISGTFRHGPTPPTQEALLDFLSDRKESEELVMVVDEELKMMSAVCPDGGVMRGPYLKPMSRVTHTEYLLEGRSRLDPREILRLTMFAPTVIGSPMGPAAKVIARHEKEPRGYYSGVLALFEATDHGYELDAPILIRTAFLVDGDITVSAGATLVRHSDPLSEAKETRSKASGMLAALGLIPEPEGPQRGGPSPAAHLVDAPEVVSALARRNRDLAPFWRDEQTPVGTIAASVLLVDCGDDFTVMLAHQLRHLGMSCRVKELEDVKGNEPEDLFFFGPGPGDPTDGDDPRVVHLRGLLADRLERGLPVVASSFSHLVLAALAGLPIETLKESRQGIPITAPLLGEETLMGFYSTFAALGVDGSRTPRFELTITSDPELEVVTSLVGRRAVSVAGHLESVLSLDGFDALARAVNHALR